MIGELLAQLLILGGVQIDEQFPDLVEDLGGF